MYNMPDYVREDVIFYIIEQVEKGREPYDIIGDNFLADKLTIEQVNVIFGDSRVVSALIKAGYKDGTNIWPW